MAENLALSNPLIQIATVLLGIVILISGRRLFWLTVAIIGFGFGLFLAIGLFGNQATWLLVLIAVAAGIVGAILAIFLQRVAVLIAGFFLGGFVLLWLLELANIDLGQWTWISYVIGGVIGSILTSALFDVALIGISALLGAAMIVQVTPFTPLINTILLVILAIIGFVVQSRTLKSE